MLAALSLGIAWLPLAGVAAAATSPVAWTQTLQGGNPVDPGSAILTDPDGDVTVGGCVSYSPKEAIETWTSGDHLVGARPITASPDPELCNGSGVTDAQGNIYSVTTNLTTGQNEMMAFKADGSDLWPAPVPLPVTCAGNPLSLGYSQPVLGADGNIYGLVYWGVVNGCPTALKLYGINHQTGALLFAKTLNSDGATDASDVSAYTGGLVVRSDNQISYYDYGGVRIGGPYALSGQQIDRDESVAATTSGRAFVATSKSTTASSSCPLTVVVDAIEAFQPGGRLWRTLISGCNQAPSINAMPDGGVMVVEESFAPGNPGATTILRYGSTGRLLWTKPDPGNVSIDVNGNIIVDSDYHLNDPSSPVLNNEPEVRVDVYNGLNGTETYDFDTANLDSANSYQASINAVGLDQGRIYLGISECTGNIYPTGGDCGSPAELWAINAPGVGIDYPRGAVLGVKPSPPPSTGPIGSATSSNWSGYVGVAQNVSKVEATWTVPQVTCSGSSNGSWVVIWAGIDGEANTNYLVQAGTGATCSSPKAQPDYYAWWESDPTTGQHEAAKVSPGAQVTVDITYRSGSTFVMQLDVNGKTQFTRDAAVKNEPRSQGECIVEAPISAQTKAPTPLTEFKPVTFTDCRITTASTTGQQIGRGSINGVAVTRFTITDHAHRAQDAVGNPGSGGVPWTVTWKHLN